MLQQRTYIATGERIRNYLGVGFLLSLVINALALPLYPDLKSQAERVKPDVFSIVHVVHISTPPPTPPPPLRKTPRVHTEPRPFAALPPITHPVNGPAEPRYVPPPNAGTDGIPGDEGTSPTSGATVDAGTTQPACATPNQDASVIGAISPDYPDSARDLALGQVSVLVQVTIDDKGRLLESRIYQSSNSAAIDQAALRAARQSTYAPKIENCVPVEGTYIFHADFAPGGVLKSRNFHASSRFARSTRM